MILDKFQMNCLSRLRPICALDYENRNIIPYFGLKPRAMKYKSVVLEIQ